MWQPTACIVLLLAAGMTGSSLAQEDLDAIQARAAALYQQGDFAEASKAATHGLAVAERQFGTESFEATVAAGMLAVVLNAQGHHPQAEALCRRALPVFEQHAGPDDPDLAVLLVNLALACQAQGRPHDAEPLYVRALAIREKSLGADHQDTVLTCNSLASLYHAQRRFALAEPLLKRVLAWAEKSFGPDHAETAAVVQSLSYLHADQGQPLQAEAFQKRALAIREKTLGPQDPATAESLNGLAELTASRGEYAQAEPLFQRALAILEKNPGPDHPQTAACMSNLGFLRFKQGRYTEAEPLYRRALAIREKSFGPDDAATAATLNGLALLCENQGRSAEAERLHGRALAIREKSLGPDHPDTGVSLANMALLHSAAGRYAQAEPLLQRALAITEKSLGPDDPATARLLNNLADLSMSTGRNARAKLLLERALAIIEKSLGPGHPDVAPCLNNLAFVSLSLGLDADAESLLRRALAINEQSLHPDHPLTARALLNLATVQATLGRHATAADLVDRARRGTRRHVAHVLPALAAVDQAAFLRTQQADEFQSALALGVHEASNPRIASLSAGWLANGKAVAQEAASQRMILARQSGLPASRAAVVALERVRADLARLSQATPAPDEAAAHRATVTERVAEEHRLVRDIGGQIAALDREEPWVEIDAIRASIPAGSVLVDVARFKIFDFAATLTDPKWKPPRYAAWIVPPAGQGDVTIVDLGPAEEIDAAVKAYREAIEAVQKGGFARGQATAEDELKITAAPLTTKVLQPIIAAIGDATDIILSPDGSLWLVPWQALPLPDGSYAIEKYAIRTVTSARDLVPVPVKATGGRGGPVVVADPAFDAAPPASTAPAADASRALMPASGVTWKFSPLPGTRAEALATKPAIAKVAGGEPQVLLGADACETKLKQAAVRPASLVLATHGFFKPDQDVKKDDSPSAAAGGRGSAPVLTTSGEPLEDPLLRCGLALAGANAAVKNGADDGILTGAEIVGLDLLGTDLVVLSACETGVGTVHNGEGVAGLRQAFQIAGAKTVVATLWQIPDAESAQLMQAFYANLEKGDPASKALRDAQLAFIKARREDRTYEAAHPYLWAAYGVTGR